MLFLPLFLINQTDLGPPGPQSRRTASTGKGTFHVGRPKQQGTGCVGQMFVSPWGLTGFVPEHPEGASGCHSQTPLDHPLKVSGAQGGPR